PREDVPKNCATEEGDKTVNVFNNQPMKSLGHRTPEKVL
ncbi:unnamed protein product, partial [marine sediment metagenome]